MRGKNSKTSFKLHWIKGVEMETQETKAIIHYLGISVLICSLSLLLYVVRWW